MKKKIFTATFLTAAMAVLLLQGCAGSTTTNSETSLPVIDWGAQIPEKRIDLNEMADIEYIPLETTDESVIRFGFSYGLDDNTLGVADYMSKTIVVFDQEGKYEYTFNKSGEGPGEYQYMTYAGIAPEDNEICVYDLRGEIFLYDMKGNFLQSDTLDTKAHLANFLYYDKECFAARIYDNLSLVPLEENKVPCRYVLVNKRTGKITYIPLAVSRPIGNSMRYPVDGNTVKAVAISSSPMARSPKGIVISDFSCDTLYEYSDGKLNPLAVYRNVVRDGKIPDIVSVNMATDRYIFLSYTRVLDVTPEDIVFDEKIGGDYIFDRKSGEIFKYSALRPYLKDGDADWTVNSSPTIGLGDTHCLSIAAERLMEWNEEGRLRPEVKKVVDKLDVEANPVVMKFRFKE